MRLLFVFSLLSISALAVDKPALQEPWQTGYSDADSTGPHVLGHWKFDGDSPLKDFSGKGNDLTAHGAKTGVSGKFGDCMESFPGFPVEDKSHGLHTDPKPKLSPTGPFTLEMWIKAKADFAPEQRAFLMDKKYTDHSDYQWTIGSADKGGQRRMTVTLGFGGDSKMWHSSPLKLGTEWHHMAFTYDAAGTGRFYWDGQSAGMMHNDGCAATVPGLKPLSIGDRLGSNFGGFPGFIDEVRICNGVLNLEQVSLRVETDRHVWQRMEQAKPVSVIVTNLQRSTMSGAKLRLVFAGKEELFEIKDLKSGKSYTAPFAINTALKPDHYSLRARLELPDYATEQSTDFDIVARAPKAMPVIMWGASPRDTAQLKDIGFTHCLGLHADLSDIGTSKKPGLPGKPEVIAKNRAMLDQALLDGLSVVASMSPKNAFDNDKANLRVDRNGKPYAREDICASMPEMATFFENVGRSMARAYGDHPAFNASLIDSEVRDATAPSFNPVDIENYRKFANAEIPAEVVTRGGVNWQKLKDFPADRVIADDNAILKYYRWFWTVGDGWNGLHSALSRGVKTSGKKMWTWFDPAVRQPSISGAGGSVDVLSHWTYTYPEPQRIGLCADQLFAMSAASGRNQQVMKMTQLIWYRSQTAPIGNKPAGDVVAWQDHDPDAAYITIAPMHLREAFWTKIARPIQGIMYHGWGSLVDDPTNTGAYRFTNANTVHVLKELTHDVVVPLGPTLMEIGDERSDVALFESFTSQMFAQRGGYGSNNGWSADLWLAMQHAHIQCDVVFEETLLKTGLGARKYLLMPECDVLTRGVVDKILAWQKKGGKIIADELLCPALKADIVVPSFKRTKKADDDKKTVLALATTLKPHLDTIGLKSKCDCDNPDIIVRTRKAGDATYVFVINDKREFGTYVGQHGMVMENGLPSSGMITLPLEGNVCELTRGGITMATVNEGNTTWNVDLGPCDGRIFMITPKPLMQLNTDLPEVAKVGNPAPLTVTISDTTNQPIKAVVPVEVRITDANGKPAEGSGYYAAVNGTVKIKLDLATNDDAGTWQVRVRELATRMERTRFMRVER